MFIPIVPSIGRTTVINKTIVYSDTVLKLDELGQNIKLTSISNVTESEFEKCIKCILSSNEDVLFNTIQYSKKDKKVYFYTNKKLDITKWENRNVKEYDRVNDRDSLLEELNYLYDSSNKPKDEDVIDLYSVYTLYITTKQAHSRIKEIFISRIEYAMKNGLNDSIYLYGITFNKNKNELELRYNSGHSSETQKIVFRKKDNEVYIVKSNTSDAYDVFNKISSIINEALDELKDFEEKHDLSDGNYCIDVVNSSLKATINLFDISLYRRTKGIKKDFELSFSNHFDSIDIDCNSSLIIDIVKNNEIKLFKNTFIKIEDCPKWMRDILYETRKQNLIEEKKLEEEKIKKQLKREKLNKIKKFFFLNSK